jgi:hypothetical protein
MRAASKDRVGMVDKAGPSTLRVVHTGDALGLYVAHPPEIASLLVPSKMSKNLAERVEHTGHLAAHVQKRQQRRDRAER